MIAPPRSTWRGRWGSPPRSGWGTRPPPGPPPPSSAGTPPRLCIFALPSGAPVTVLDGDAALLMHLGTLVNVGRHVRTPFLHVLLDNGVHESTGGQRAAGDGLDFAALALHCGYRAAWSCHGTDAIAQ